MAVDAAGEDQQPGGIDLLLAARQILAECDDAATANSHVAAGDVAGIDDRATANDEVIRRHENVSPDAKARTCQRKLPASL
jgi:hypothetical protein